jgi:oligopeptide transport system permease protein
MKKFASDKIPRKKLLSMHIDMDAFMPATNEQKEQQVHMLPSTTFFKDGMRKLFKNPLQYSL